MATSILDAARGLANDYILGSKNQISPPVNDGFPPANVIPGVTDGQGNDLNAPEVPVEQPKKKAATTIIWKKETPTVDTGDKEINTAVNDAADPTIKPIVKSGDIAKAVDANLNKKVATKLKELDAKTNVGNNRDRLAMKLDELQVLIDKEDNKRDAIAMLGFAISLMGGKNAASAAQAANSWAKMSDKKVNALYSQRKLITDAVTKGALSQAGFTSGDETSKQGTVGWRGSDDKIYFQSVEDGVTKWKTAKGDALPDNVELENKTGTSSEGDLPRWVGNTLVDATKVIRTTKTKLARIENIVNAQQDAWSGAFGKGAEFWKKLVGGQDENSEYRRLIEELIGSESLSNLPPGTASNKDIEIVRAAQVNGFANREAVQAWLDAIKRISNYQIKYNQAYLNYFKDGERDPTGFVGPEYEGNAGGSSNSSAGLSRSSSDLNEILNN